MSTYTAYHEAKQDELREFVWTYKRKPCMDCGGTFHPCAMDFDHREQRFGGPSIAAGVGRRWSKEHLLAEMAKCDLVCANCHRVRTYNKKQWRHKTSETPQERRGIDGS